MNRAGHQGQTAQRYAWGVFNTILQISLIVRIVEGTNSIRLYPSLSDPAMPCCHFQQY